jgi:hypothetical protein
MLRCEETEGKLRPFFLALALRLSNQALALKTPG